MTVHILYHLISLLLHRLRLEDGRSLHLGLETGDSLLLSPALLHATLAIGEQVLLLSLYSASNCFETGEMV